MALIDIQVPDIGDFDEVTVIELMVKVAPVISAGPSLPSRAFLASSDISALICSTPFLSQSRMTGTIKPLGVSAAKPMCQ